MLLLEGFGGQLSGSFFILELCGRLWRGGWIVLCARFVDGFVMWILLVSDVLV